MEHVVWSAEPRLRSPVMIVAFSGWNDAADGATGAAQRLAARWQARPFATIEAEEFFDFTAIRPQVRLTDGVTREIMWPNAEFLAAPVTGARSDVVFLFGIEPALKWKTFSREVIEVARKLGVQLVITLGALLADVPHSRAVQIIGTSTDQRLIDRFDLRRSQYQGPTGIVGVLNDECSKAGLPSLSLWAAVPAYAAQVPSPKAAAALIERTGELLDLNLDDPDLRNQVAAYEQQIDELVSADGDLVEFVDRLEHLIDSGYDDDEDDGEDDDNNENAPADPGPLDADEVLRSGTGDELVAEVEQFLRGHRNDG